MPRLAKGTNKPLYHRGNYSLIRKPGQTNLVIRWYDAKVGYTRNKSAETDNLELAKKALDKFHDQQEGGPTKCPTCGQCMDKGNAKVREIVRSYLSLHGDDQTSAKAIASRLAHIVRYIDHLGTEPVANDITERWIRGFRAWLAKDPYANGKTVKFRSLATIENSVVQLQAAFNMAKEEPQFKPHVLAGLSRTPEHRSDEAELARMFDYCLYPKARTEKERVKIRSQREGLLAFLRFGVATWARPDAILDAVVGGPRKQWISRDKAFHLNPVGRVQTKKHRPTVPVPDAAAAWLDSLVATDKDGKGVPVVPALGKQTWARMATELGLPKDGESGMKLVRRSMAKLVQGRVGLEHKAQVQMQMGHHKFSVTDLYTLSDPTLLGRALAATTAIIADIEAACPGAYRVSFESAVGEVVDFPIAKNG